MPIKVFFIYYLMYLRYHCKDAFIFQRNITTKWVPISQCQRQSPSGEILVGTQPPEFDSIGLTVTPLDCMPLGMLLILYINFVFSFENGYNLTRNMKIEGNNLVFWILTKSSICDRLY